MYLCDLEIIKSVCMKNVLCNALLLLGLTSNVMVQAESNPFFGKYKTPFETPPFDKIKTNIMNRHSSEVLLS